MKVLSLRADTGGCAFYRMVEPARVVQKLDPSVNVQIRPDIDVEARENSITGEVTVLEIKEDIDLLIIQRPLKQHMLPVIEQAKKQGIAVIVEIDDDFEKVHRDNRTWREVQPQYNPNENYEWLAKSIEASDLFTVSTPRLGRLKPRGETAVLRNCVPESIFSLTKTESDRPINVGWTGTIQTHPADLQTTRGKVGEALKGSDAGFYVVGDGEGVQAFLRLDPSIPFNKSGWVELRRYYRTILDNIDIGIVPLERSDFNSAKSGLKLLEMSALGIPTIAAATPENIFVNSHGIGELADSPGDYKRTLSRWLQNEDRRRVLAERSRDMVKEYFTYEQNAQQWLDAWTRAIDIRKAAQK